MLVLIIFWKRLWCPGSFFFLGGGGGVEDGLFKWSWNHQVTCPRGCLQLGVRETFYANKLIEVVINASSSHQITLPLEMYEASVREHAETARSCVQEKITLQLDHRKLLELVWRTFGEDSVSHWLRLKREIIVCKKWTSHEKSFKKEKKKQSDPDTCKIEKWKKKTSHRTGTWRSCYSWQGPGVSWASSVTCTLAHTHTHTHTRTQRENRDSDFVQVIPTEKDQSIRRFEKHTTNTRLDLKQLL